MKKLVWAFVGVVIGFMVGLLQSRGPANPDYSPVIDSLINVIDLSHTREDKLIKSLTRAYISLDSIEAIETTHKAKIKNYEKELKKARTTVIHDLDSFFINRYPSPGDSTKMESGKDSTRTTGTGRIIEANRATRQSIESIGTKMDISEGGKQDTDFPKVDLSLYDKDVIVLFSGVIESFGASDTSVTTKVDSALSKSTKVINTRTFNQAEFQTIINTMSEEIAWGS